MITMELGDGSILKYLLYKHEDLHGNLQTHGKKCAWLDPPLTLVLGWMGAERDESPWRRGGAQRGRHGGLGRKLRAYVFNSNCKAERANWKCHEVQSLPPQAHFLQQNCTC